MADQAATVPTQLEEKFPLAGIICIAIGAYMVVMVALLILRQILMQRGYCSQHCGCCGKEGEPPCYECCLSCAESFNCCKYPNITGCLDSICPARRQMDCADIIMCQCCTDPNNQCCSCCASEEPLCDCGNCDCVCNCQPPECDSINCCCFEISLKQPHGGEPYPGMGYPGTGGYTQTGGYYTSPTPRAGPGYPVPAPVVGSDNHPVPGYPSESPRGGGRTGAGINWAGGNAEHASQHTPVMANSPAPAPY